MARSHSQRRPPTGPGRLGFKGRGQVKQGIGEFRGCPRMSQFFCVTKQELTC